MKPHRETHLAQRASWLRAAVLGANDGIVSTASLVLGVAASDASPAAVLTAGLAGLVGGALSMAAGEYVSVSSQRDVEHADLARERRELREQPEHELEELTLIYAGMGLERALAEQVAVALTTHGDPLRVHAREELGLDPDDLARPVRARGGSGHPRLVAARSIFWHGVRRGRRCRCAHPRAGCGRPTQRSDVDPAAHEPLSPRLDEPPVV